MHARDRGLKSVTLSADRGQKQVAAFRAAIQPLARQLLERAKAAGALREDVTSFDIPMIYQAVGAIADRTRDVAPDYFERTLTLLVDGLARERTPTPDARPAARNRAVPDDHEPPPPLTRRGPMTILPLSG